ncbi:unnamed protein product [Leptidea sinapis]|uniref:Uncharacterized protein n=1 Tax=Leptidea sinapis TaxID=189913 RepID=A0A5E4R662_9NEOP|nr:unnamed protein product [Leptidea sinapis]
MYLCYVQLKVRYNNDKKFSHLDGAEYGLLSILCITIAEVLMLADITNYIFRRDININISPDNITIKVQSEEFISLVVSHAYNCMLSLLVAANTVLIHVGINSLIVLLRVHAGSELHCSVLLSSWPQFTIINLINKNRKSRENLHSVKEFKQYPNSQVTSAGRDQTNMAVVTLRFPRKSTVLYSNDNYYRVTSMDNRYHSTSHNLMTKCSLFTATMYSRVRRTISTVLLSN